ncbi:hypothetical protein PDJAM_G00042200 [Pangasius djambal]|uniref:Uncharacterized protein n=1 Tax=Pangasius djambal TaxID=1691987 RepID=A0ACC5YUK2_9TELE|nr:hypothetical protein [Pangasius djambal]
MVRVRFLAMKPTPAHDSPKLVPRGGLCQETRSSDHLITCGPSDPLKDFGRIFYKMDSVPTIFRVFQIFIPTFAVIIFCTGLCKCFLQHRRRRQEQRQLARAAAHAQEPSRSVYIIPFSPSDDQQHRPPCYSLAGEYTPPPAYNELVKPDFPCDPPPSYTESISPTFFSSHSDGTTPSCPTMSE